MADGYHYPTVKVIQPSYISLISGSFVPFVPPDGTPTELRTEPRPAMSTNEHSIISFPPESFRVTAPEVIGRICARPKTAEFGEWAPASVPFSFALVFGELLADGPSGRQATRPSWWPRLAGFKETERLIHREKKQGHKER